MKKFAPDYRMIASETIARLYIAQRGRCIHCNGMMDHRPAGDTKSRYGNHANGWTREHVVPLSAGGKGRRNIVLAHARCNERRGVIVTPDMGEKARSIIEAALALDRTEIGPDAIEAVTKPRYDYPVD